MALKVRIVLRYPVQNHLGDLWVGGRKGGKEGGNSREEGREGGRQSRQDGGSEGENRKGQVNVKD